MQCCKVYMCSMLEIVKFYVSVAILQNFVLPIAGIIYLIWYKIYMYFHTCIGCE